MSHNDSSNEKQGKKKILFTAILTILMGVGLYAIFGYQPQQPLLGNSLQENLSVKMFKNKDYKNVTALINSASQKKLTLEGQVFIDVRNVSQLKNLELNSKTDAPVEYLVQLEDETILHVHHQVNLFDLMMGSAAQVADDGQGGIINDLSVVPQGTTNTVEVVLTIQEDDKPAAPLNALIDYSILKRSRSVLTINGNAGTEDSNNLAGAVVNLYTTNVNSISYKFITKDVDAVGADYYVKIGAQDASLTVASKFKAVIDANSSDHFTTSIVGNKLTVDNNESLITKAPDNDDSLSVSPAASAIIFYNGNLDTTSNYDLNSANVNYTYLYATGGITPTIEMESDGEFSATGDSFKFMRWQNATSNVVLSYDFDATAPFDENKTIYARYGSIIYVNDTAVGANDGSNWANAFNTLQAGLDEWSTEHSAADSTLAEVWVAQGTYNPIKQTDESDVRSATFNFPEGISVYGNFDGEENRNERTFNGVLVTDLTSDNRTEIETVNSILSGAHIFPSVYHVVRLRDNVILDGFRISGGNANGSSNPSQRGGGINASISSSTIKHCYITGNSAEKYGGGIYNFASSIKVSLTSISQNIAGTRGGGMYSERTSAPTVEDSWFYENRCLNHAGGAVYNFQSSSTFKNVDFVLNHAAEKGGAVYNALGDVSTGRSPSYEDCTFDQNVAGGQRYQGPEPFINFAERVFNNPDYVSPFTRVPIGNSTIVTVGGSTFYRRTGQGGAVFNLNSSSSFVNTTFTLNCAGEGGAVYSTDVNTIGGDEDNEEGVDGEDTDEDNAIVGGTGSSSQPYFENCNFGSINALNQANYAMEFGGAIFVNKTSTVLVDSHFDDNNAAAGGSIYALGSEVVISNTVLENNRARQREIYDVAFYQENPENGLVAYSIGLMGGQGGAICADDSTVRISGDTTLAFGDDNQLKASTNFAEDSGGFLFAGKDLRKFEDAADTVNHSGGSIVSVQNMILGNNFAMGSGGAIWGNAQSTITTTKCEFGEDAESNIAGPRARVEINEIFEAGGKDPILKRLSRDLIVLGNTWEPYSVMPVRRKNLTMNASEKGLYYMGGVGLNDTQDGFILRNEAYTLGGDPWSAHVAINNLPVAVAMAPTLYFPDLESSPENEEALYVFGGYTTVDENSGELGGNSKQIQRYSFESESWSVLGEELDNAVSNGTPVIVGSTTTVYIFGSHGVEVVDLGVKDPNVPEGNDLPDTSPARLKAASRNSYNGDVDAAATTTAESYVAFSGVGQPAHFISTVGALEAGPFVTTGPNLPTVNSFPAITEIVGETMYSIAGRTSNADGDAAEDEKRSGWTMAIGGQEWAEAPQYPGRYWREIASTNDGKKIFAAGGEGDDIVGYGGAIAAFGTLNIEECNFSYNISGIAETGQDEQIADAKGGAIYMGDIPEDANLNVTQALNVRNAEFVNNTTIAIDVSFGGAIYLSNETLDGSIRDATFTSNVANLTTAGWEKERNIGETLTGGGAIYQLGSELSIENTQFESNNNGTVNTDWSLSNNGGAIFTTQTTNLDRCSFNQNSVMPFDDICRGGAIASTGKLTINRSSFTENRATKGGAVYVDAGTAIINNTSFIRNYAEGFFGIPEEWVSGGGAIMNEGSLSVDKSRFTANLALWGDAIQTIGTFEMNNSLLDDHPLTSLETSSTSSRGTIFGHGTIRNSTFENNHSAIGAALTGFYKVENSVIRYNHATSGGGVYSSEFDDFTVGQESIFTNTIFNGNWAANGGAAYVTNAQPDAGEQKNWTQFINCIIAGNISTGNGGGIYNSLSNPVIVNTVLWDNYSLELIRSGNDIDGVAQFYTDDGTTWVYSSTVMGGAGTADPELGNIGLNDDADPLFVVDLDADEYHIENDPSDDLDDDFDYQAFINNQKLVTNFRPLAGSPTLDSGTTTREHPNSQAGDTIVYPITDFDGKNRDDLIDRSAFEGIAEDNKLLVYFQPTTVISTGSEASIELGTDFGIIQYNTRGETEKENDYFIENIGSKNVQLNPQGGVRESVTFQIPDDKLYTDFSGQWFQVYRNESEKQRFDFITTDDEMASLQAGSIAIDLRDEPVLNNIPSLVLDALTKAPYDDYLLSYGVTGKEEYNSSTSAYEVTIYTNCFKNVTDFDPNNDSPNGDVPNDNAFEYVGGSLVQGSEGTFSLSGTSSTDFVVTQIPPAIIPPGGKAEFKLKFLPNIMQIVRDRTANISVEYVNVDHNSNAEEPSSEFLTYDFDLAGQIDVSTEPVLEVYSLISQELIENGDEEPSPIDGTDFGVKEISIGVQANTFILSNSGGGALKIVNVEITGLDSSGLAQEAFTVISQPSDSDLLEGTTTLPVQIQYAPKSLGLHEAFVTISTTYDDLPQTPYIFYIEGQGVGPDATVYYKDQGNEIVNGSEEISLTIGTMIANVSINEMVDIEGDNLNDPVEQTYSKAHNIVNLGDAFLNLTSLPPVQVLNQNVGVAGIDFFVDSEGQPKIINLPTDLANQYRVSVTVPEATDANREAFLNTSHTADIHIENNQELYKYKVGIEFLENEKPLADATESTYYDSNADQYVDLDLDGDNILPLNTVIQLYARSSNSGGDGPRWGFTELNVSLSRAYNLKLVWSWKRYASVADETDGVADGDTLTDGIGSSADRASYTLATPGIYHFNLEVDDSGLSNNTDELDQPIRILVGDFLSLSLAKQEAVEGSGEVVGTITLPTAPADGVSFDVDLSISTPAIDDERVSFSNSETVLNQILTFEGDGISTEFSFSIFVREDQGEQIKNLADPRTLRVIGKTAGVNDGIAIIEIFDNDNQNIEIYGNNSLIDSGETETSEDNDTDFGEIRYDISSPEFNETVTNTFTIRNVSTVDAADGTLNISSISLNGEDTESSASFSYEVPSQPIGPWSLLPGESLEVEITCTPVALGLKRATLSVVNDDPDKNPYEFKVQATAVGYPNMSVFYKTADRSIQNGETINSTKIGTNFGKVEITSGITSQNRTFTVANEGTRELLLTGSPLVRISGSSDFTLVPSSFAPSSVIGEGIKTTFEIVFNPSSVGNKEATLLISNNDETKDPYTFKIYGEGIDSTNLVVDDDEQDSGRSGGGGGGCSIGGADSSAAWYIPFALLALAGIIARRRREDA
ncbi:MAG: choice-of-anchor D domain-containing protein [Lentisphaeria bacterium]|nr:choice-of-anchor D domain-containing protein [Lentisphaeria bacterium]